MKRLLLLFAAICCTAMMQAETLTNVKYIDANGVEQICPSATVITDGYLSNLWYKNETNGWYVATGTVTTQGLFCNGEVHLILADGAKLTTTGKEREAGITVRKVWNARLTIYGQAAQSGQLIANGGENAAGIGGQGVGFDALRIDGSDIIINGGIVTATGSEGGAAGIGGGYMGSGSNITINGGTVTATSRGGAGIGGGYGGSGSNITINGGTVTAMGGMATGSRTYVSIGGGYHGTSGTVTINGGAINAEDIQGDIQIYGGIFPYLPKDEWIASDCVVGENWDEATKDDYPWMVVDLSRILCFTANTSSSTVQLNKVGEPYEAALVYSATGMEWYPYEFGQTITLTDAGDRVFFRNASDDLAKGFSKGFNDYYQFAMTGSVAASGNVMSLLDKTCLATSFPANGTYCFACLFSGCESLTSAPELPAMTLAQGCYYWMFNGCTGLTSAPELPAMTLAYGCYLAMYDNCTGLKQVPALPATTMETFCYAAMFRGCTSLTEAPELSATTLKDYCYSEMFENCTSLETAPTLPATTLPNRCYDQMFSGCTKLNQVKVAFTEWGNSTTGNWLKDVAPKGIIICPDELGTETRGVSNVPEGWSVNGYEISVSAVGWASMYLPIDVTIPDGVEVYYAASASGNVVTLKSIADAIPAHTGVIVKAATGTVFFPYTATAVTPVEGNLFEGTSVDKACSANENYVLSGKSTAGKPIFQPYTGMSLGAFKSYLPKSAVGGAGSIQFRFGDDGDTTVISTVETEVAEDVIYNLAGQRVGSDYRGIVIKNGKKVWNK